MTEEMIMTAHKYADDNRQKIADANPSITFEVIRSLHNLKDGSYIVLSDCFPEVARKVWSMNIRDGNCHWGQDGRGSNGHSWSKEHTRIATIEEISNFLIKKASDLGYKSGDIRIPNSNWHTGEREIRIPNRTIPSYTYNEINDRLTLNGRNIYREGMWARRG